ncbi:LysR family transcriptional regulator [Pseudovibrio sp. Tun.PSC04-5.I4]|uniref:LysR family transcriptional regulator n=1 Tax=Pseudovibrio sp. Tun.PSC04-5.I4 TaxID=1798213 RepID=UPI0008858F1B|nr:LysR family transcriptional regulator [Pseudovibrio sp. Tun.PSC04-5.I4]SDR37857.1 DNA-binding transcriptional regulator, LysR family [Pseudovibrio sp. Tun.PSC04-5.I4]
MDIRQLQYLVVLAEERHFTRAAAACNVTQPTLSGRIRQLEIELGAPIIERGKKFHGLTAEGERILVWAKRVLADCNSLRNEVSGKSTEVFGKVNIGVIPSAVAAVAPLLLDLKKKYPLAHATIQLMSHDEVHQALEDYRIDAGITYTQFSDAKKHRSFSLYEESYRLFMPVGHALQNRDELEWEDAFGAGPMVALALNMQNRQMVDSTLRFLGVELDPEIEAETISSLGGFICAGYCAILPELSALSLGPGVVSVPLVKPVVSHQIGMVMTKRELEPAIITSLTECAGQYKKPLIPEKH